MAQNLPGPHENSALPPRSGRPRGPGQPPDDFDRWLDRNLRDMFDEKDGKVVPPQVKALREPKPGKAKPLPPKRR